MKEVLVLERNRINLLGLILANFLTRQQADGSPSQSKRIKGLKGTLRLVADGMRIFVEFADRITISRDRPDARTSAAVTGEMSALVGLMAGKGWLKAVLTGRIGFRGNPVTLLRLFLVFIFGR